MKDNLVLAVLVLALLALSACGTWAGSDRFLAKDGHSTSIDITSENSPLAWTQSLYNWTLKHVGYAGISLDSSNSKDAPVVPEARTLYGFGSALLLNGLGTAGIGYYLRRRYNRASATRFAGRHAVRLPMFVDTAVSLLVLLVLSPALIAISAAAALRSGAPKVYGRTREMSGIDKNSPHPELDSGPA